MALQRKGALELQQEGYRRDLAVLVFEGENGTLAERCNA
jgi:hypothetical protein